VADSPAATTPFKDFRLRKAVNIAIDRNRMGQQMFRRWFYLVGPLPGSIKRWALPQAELVQKPGYRFDTQERQEDLAEAKKLWEAAGGPGIGKFTVTYAGIPGYLADFFPQFQEMLREALGADTEWDLDITGYTRSPSASVFAPCAMSAITVPDIDTEDWLARSALPIRTPSMGVVESACAWLASNTRSSSSDIRRGDHSASLAARRGSGKH
jgi:ABC-type transport system substrate-binding protein